MNTYTIEKGSPFPLGFTKTKTGGNFALFSQHATQVALCLFQEGQKHPFLEVELDPKVHKSNYHWHISVGNLPSTFTYGYKVGGPLGKGYAFNPSLIVVDPYAKAVTAPEEWGTARKGRLLGKVEPEEPFAWEEDKFPRIPWKELVIYEMHVRAFTKDVSSGVAKPGTFLGIIEKIPYLKKLGINAVELLPVFEFDELEYDKVHPTTQERLYNFWGYSSVHFFAPMRRYGTMAEFKQMVKALHKHEIEVILDVVFNHTAEGKIHGPTFSFRAIDNSTYYLLDKEGNYLDYTGCGNTVNANHPIVTFWILDVLRFWVSEMHVDGFRFDLASALTRDSDGTPLKTPPLISKICKDPILASTKLIAEAWDVGGLYQVGSFPGNGRFAEWNGKYRDSVRKFLKGTEGSCGEFAHALLGSSELFGKRSAPYCSINFVTAHDGFSLKDLVSYQEKHNFDNGENNQDGLNYNDSWNCGEEGETSKPEILALRERQMRNFLVALMVSLGTPMILMGDEYGHTRKGNNNVWCQDNELNWFLWDHCSSSFHNFVSFLLRLRKEHPLLKRNTYPKKQEIEWHGKTPFSPDWGPKNLFVAYTLKDLAAQHSLYIAFNAHAENVLLTLPPPPSGKQWHRLVDTSLSLEAPSPLNSTYTLSSHSALIAQEC